MAAFGPQNAARAAGRGYSLAMGMGPSHDVYVAALRVAGRDPADYRFVSGPVGRGLPPVGELRQKNFAFGGMPFMVGPVDEVGEKMRAMSRTAPLDELVLYFHPPGMPTEAARRAMTIFAEQIMPDTRDWGTAN